MISLEWLVHDDNVSDFGGKLIYGQRKADMIIYTIEDGLTKVETTFDGDTVWLSIESDSRIVSER